MVKEAALAMGIALLTSEPIGRAGAIGGDLLNPYEFALIGGFLCSYGNFIHPVHIGKSERGGLSVIGGIEKIEED